jgi:pyruvate formate-lyase/glycerol dehydratase family glycyl radical enzyme
MSAITLKDIRLGGYTLDSLPLLKHLRTDLLQTKPAVCIERARHMTRFLRDMSSDDDPMITRFAGATAHFLSKKQPFFFDDNLLAGTTCAKPFGAPVYPEWTGMTIWPELDVISTREKNPQGLTRAEAEELNFEIYPYWMQRNVLEVTRKRHNNPECMRLFERIVFFIAGKAGTISHTVPYYTMALEQGVEHIIALAAQKEQALKAESSSDADQQRSLLFYQAVQKALQGVIAYAANLSAEAALRAQTESDPRRKANFEQMAIVCAQVPAKPARTFREAVNALWIIQVAIHAENINMAMSPGRLDQVLYPWFQRDMAEGRLTVTEALELIGCLWLKLNDNTNLVPETAEELFGGAGTVPAVTLGGVDMDGKDAVNDLTYLMLRVTELLQTRDPSLNARYHQGVNSPTYRNRVAEVIANTRSVPAVHNDIADIRTLENQGVRTEHARDYAIIGCVELATAGRSYDASSSIMLNLVSVLELALYNGKRPVTGDDQIGPATGEPVAFADFDEFWNAFAQQFKWVAGHAVRLNEMFGRVYQDILPSPLLSAFFQGPLDKGRDLIHGGAQYNASGATHIGFADTVDSINAIEQAVFKDRKFTFAELLTALQADFKGHEKLHAYLVNRTPKFGSADPAAQANAQRVIKLLYDFYQEHTNYRGGKYRPAFWSMTNHAGQGKLSGALPNGRKAFKVFASGITPVSQAAADLAACLQSVGGLDPICIPGGEAFNLKYPTLNGAEDIEKFGAGIETYFECGGLHIQCNIMAYEMLLDARENPEKYPELLVRVSGYSAYFKDLNDAMKEEIITRTAYDLHNGRAVPFPDDHSGMLGTK